MGRPPVPEDTKVLRGTFRDDRANPSPATFPRGADCPDQLRGESRREWDRLAPTLTRLGLLTSGDRAAFAVYCQAWADWIAAVEHIRKRGRVLRVLNGAQFSYQQNPACKMKATAAKELKDLGALFGLSPSARVKVQANPEPETDDDDRFFE